MLDSFDSIRTQLLRDDGAEAARVLLVTSAAAGEGKTTLAGHLASSLARAGRKTLLIDGDLRRPSVHQLFELPQQPGFSEVLLGEVEAADAVQNTPQDGLAVIAAGQWDREVMQALARDGLEGIFEKLREEFDFIIVDSHPVLSATDSLLIGQHVRRGDPVGAARREPDAAGLRGQPEADGAGHSRPGRGGQRRRPRTKCSPGAAPPAARRRLRLQARGVASGVHEPMA